MTLKYLTPILISYFYIKLLAIYYYVQGFNETTRMETIRVNLCYVLNLATRLFSRWTKINLIENPKKVIRNNLN